MTKLWNFLKGKKSYIVSATGVLYALVVVGWQAGDWTSANQMILASLGLAGLKHGQDN